MSQDQSTNPSVLRSHGQASRAMSRVLKFLKGGLLPEAELAFFTSLKAGGRWEQRSRRRICMPLRLAAFSL